MPPERPTTPGEITEVFTTAPAAPPLPSQAAPALSPPGFEIVRELGRGGMGVVYLARQAGLNRDVALKMILSGGHTSAEERRRFLAEAEAVAAVRHPGIVEVYEYGDHEGLPFFALELCPGGSLADRLRDDPLPPAEAARVVEAVARAMAHAHQKGVVHRDLKPGNVLLGEDGAPKVTDFGLAKRLEAAVGMTRTGAVMGTPSYMAPEQAQGKKEVGPAADVYALGAILYECLTGRPPFQAATSVDTILQVVTDEPVSPSRLNPKLPRDLETVAMKCLEKLPGRRYESAQALAEDLRRWRQGEPILARPVRPLERAWKWQRRNPAIAWSVAAVMAAVVLGGGFSVYYGLMAGYHAGRATDALVEAQRKAEEAAGNARAAEAQLERAERLVYAAQIERAQRAWLNRDAAAARAALDACRWDLRGWEHRHLSGLLRRDQIDWWGADTVTSVAYSPDGRLLAGGGPRGVTVSDAVTGRRLHTLEGRSALAFSPGGARLAGGAAGAAVAVWDARAGQKLWLQKGHTGVVRAAAFSPDGALLVTVGGQSGGEVKVWDAQNGRLRHDLKGHSMQAAGVAFTPDGGRFLTCGRDEKLIVWDARAGRPLREWRGHDGEVNDVAYSPDGETIATAGDDETVRLWDARTGRELRVLRGHAGIVISVAFSPDGARLASGGTDRTVRLWDVQTGQEVSTFVGHEDAVWKVAFRPDGAWLASATEGSEAKVWDARRERGVTPPWKAAGVVGGLLSPDGDRVATLTHDLVVRVHDVDTGRELFSLGHRSRGNNLAFSLDGKRLATSLGQGGVTIWDAWTGQELVTLRGRHSGGPWRVAFSPDGSRLATVGGEDKPEPVKVWDTSTGDLIRDLHGHNGQALGVAFAPDGRRLASVGAGEVILWEVREGRPLLRLPGATWAVAFSPDGSRLAASGRHVTARVWDARTGRELLTLNVPAVRGLDVGWSPDGTRLVTGCSDGKVRLWDAATGQEVMTWHGPPCLMWSAAFSADGRRLLAAGRSDQQQTQGKRGWIEVWDAPGAAGPATFVGHDKRLKAASLTAPGDRVVGRDDAGRLVAWDVKTGRPVPDFDGPFPEKASAVLPDGSARLELLDGAARLVPRGYTEPPRQALLDPAWHREQLDQFEKLGDTFAAAFHLDRLLAARPAERPALLARRARLLTRAPANDAVLLLRARAAVVAPASDPDRHRLLPEVSRIASAHGPALARRTLGGLQLRAGSPDLAVVSLETALRLRPAGAPPIEELLLALAHAALGRADTARGLAAAPDTTPADDFCRVEYELLREEVRRTIGPP